MSDTDGARAKPSFYTASETAEILRLDESTLYRHLRSGTFPGIKIGGRYVVPGAVIDRLVADVLLTGRCVDLVGWTERWRQEQASVAAQIAGTGIQLGGGVT
jgi:excisionase family DNA binding protein